MPGGVAPKFGSEKVSRYTGVSQLQLRVSRYTVQLRQPFCAPFSCVFLKMGPRWQPGREWNSRFGLLKGCVFLRIVEVVLLTVHLFYLRWGNRKQKRPNPMSGWGETASKQAKPNFNHKQKKTEPNFNCKQQRATASKNELTNSKKLKERPTLTEMTMRVCAFPETNTDKGEVSEITAAPIYRTALGPGSAYDSSSWCVPPAHVQRISNMLRSPPLRSRLLVQCLNSWISP